jgi:hypothetical protein
MLENGRGRVRARREDAGDVGERRVVHHRQEAKRQGLEGGDDLAVARRGRDEHLRVDPQEGRAGIETIGLRRAQAR